MFYHDIDFFSVSRVSVFLSALSWRLFFGSRYSVLCSYAKIYDTIEHSRNKRSKGESRISRIRHGLKLWTAKRPKKGADKRIPAKMPKNKFAKKQNRTFTKTQRKTETIAKITEISQRLISNYCSRDLINHPVWPDTKHLTILMFSLKCCG